MKLILTILFLFSVSFSAFADPITFQFTSASINGIPITSSMQWQYAGDLRYMIPMNGKPVGDTLGIGWYGFATGVFSKVEDYLIVVKGYVSSGSAGSDVTFSGILRTTQDGLRWILPPSTVSLSYNVHLGSITNTPVSPNHTADFAYSALVGASATPTPEPATLLLLGTGLVTLASKVKKKKA